MRRKQRPGRIPYSDGGFWKWIFFPEYAEEAPVDEIKLDMRFLSAADPYGRAEEILHMIITMGNHMKLSIIAEGVETEQQKVMLQGFGCNKAQGYFYARPMREAEYTELLRKEKAEN